MHTQLALVGDIGGTNARLALLEANTLLPESIQLFNVESYPSLDEVVATYLQQQDVTVTRACFAVAGPVTNDTVDITNSQWSIERQSFQSRFDLEQLEIINDFAAQALSVPHLNEGELLRVGPDLAAVQHAPKLILGPGTGLGMCSLIETAAGWRALPGEGGNVDFCPSNERDIHLWRFLRNRFKGSAGYERVLSGSGLELLYEAYAAMSGNNELLTAPEITRKALSEPKSLSFEVVEHFCELLGHCAGNAALTIGAQGGVYITGGIVPRIKDVFLQGAFRKAFERRDKLQGYMKSIPTWLIMAEFPGLTGAAAWLNAGRYT